MGEVRARLFSLTVLSGLRGLEDRPSVDISPSASVQQRFCSLVNGLLPDQMLARLFSLNSLLGLSVYFPVGSSFSKELCQGRLSRTLCLHYVAAPTISLFYFAPSPRWCLFMLACLQ